MLEINLCNFAHFYGNFMNRFYQYAINHDFLKKYLWEITNICDILTIFFSLREVCEKLTQKREKLLRQTMATVHRKVALMLYFAFVI